MADYGVTEKGFVIKRLDKILEEIHTDLTDGFGFNTRQDPQSFLNVLITTFGGKISELWEVAQNSYYAKYPSTAEGASLDNAVQYGGIRRGANKYSYYKLHCTGDDGAEIPAGTVVATNTMPQMKLGVVYASIITRSSFNKAIVKVAAAETGDIYTLSINGTQYSYTSRNDVEEDIARGLYEAINADGYTINFDEANAQISISDNTVTRNNTLVLSDNLTTVSVTSLIDFATQEYGKLVFPNGTISVIVTAASGFNKVENLIMPIYGSIQETDVELRHSYIAKSAIRSSRMVDSICAQLLTNVANVESATGYENDSDITDSEGRPPHSIEIVVDGGNAADIAAVILDKKAGGIQTVGTESYDIATTYGDTITVKFNRPEYLYVWMKVAINANVSDLPIGYSTTIVDSIINDTSGMKAGEDLLTQTLNSGIYASVNGVTYIDIKCAVTSDSSYIPAEKEYTSYNVAVTKRQKVVVTDTRIEVVCIGNS